MIHQIAGIVLLQAAKIGETCTLPFIRDTFGTLQYITEKKGQPQCAIGLADCMKSDVLPIAHWRSLKHLRKSEMYYQTGYPGATGKIAAASTRIQESTVLKKIYALAIIVGLGGCIVEPDRDGTEMVGKANQAVVSNIVSATFTMNGSTVTAKTGDMPKGWFTPLFSKSPITVLWSADATICNSAISGSCGSAAGTFSTLFNNGGQTIGYSWSMSHSLAGLENHWHNYVACDGSVTMVGSSEARTVNYSLTVGGSCGSDPAKCTATGSVSLPAIQDADVVETNCFVGCDLSLGPYISACQANCANGDSFCSSCCECKCKKELNTENSACEAPQRSCYVDTPDRPACL